MIYTNGPRGWVGVSWGVGGSFVVEVGGCRGLMCKISFLLVAGGGLFSYDTFLYCTIPVL